jgi:hypothetical protein
LLQLFLLSLASYELPITPLDIWKPIDSTLPIPRMLMILVSSVGLPYVVLATTTPLLQRWLSMTQVSPRVTWYFAVSNLGSFIGLLGFPFILEPLASSKIQTEIWSNAFLFYGICFAICSVVTVAIVGVAKKPDPAKMCQKLIWSSIVSWIFWAALGTSMLLATTCPATTAVMHTQLSLSGGMFKLGQDMNAALFCISV